MKNKVEAQQAAAEAAAKIAELRAKAETGVWGDAEQSALDNAKKSLADAQSAEKRFAEFEQLEMATSTYKSGQDQRSATTTASNPITVNYLKQENRGDNEEKAAKMFSMFDAARQIMRHESLSGFCAEIDQEGKREARNNGIDKYGTGNITLPAWMVSQKRKMEKRDMLAGTTTAGGFTVQTEIGELIPFLDPRLSVLEMGATYLPGQTGNIDFPRNNAAATVGRKTEVAAADETDPTFDRLQMSPNRLGAFTDISKQLMVQSSIDVENFIRRRLNFAIAKALDYALINGDGSTIPITGILNTAGIGAVAIGTNGGVPTWAHIVNLETEVAVDDADMGTLSYLTTPGIRGKLKQTEKASSTGQFVWENDNPGLVQMGSLNGYRAFVSTQVPKDLTKGSGTNLHAIIFGNFAELMVGQWAGIDLVVDPYSGAKNALVTLVVNSWWDAAVRHAASFSAVKDASLS